MGRREKKRGFENQFEQVKQKNTDGMAGRMDGCTNYGPPIES